MRVVAFLLVLFLTVPVDACVWIKGTTKEGSRTMTSGLSTATRLRMQLKTSVETDLRVEGATMEEYLRGSLKFDDRNDYAVALMYLGRATEAVDLLQKLESERPGDYAVAANLGTAYELAGQNSEAKKWIEEAIRRNLDSHHGTEWLHVAILESKIQQEQNPAHFEKHSVLNLDYRALQAGAEKILVGGQERELKRIFDALQFQLSERLKFIKKADPVVASLLFDYAAIEAGTGTLESARGLLKMAAEYGYPQAQINPLLDQYAAIIQFAKLKSKLYVAGGAFALAALLFYAIKRRWITYGRKSSRALPASP